LNPVRVAIVCLVPEEGGVPSKTYDLARALKMKGCDVFTLFLGKMPSHPRIGPSQVNAKQYHLRNPIPVIRALSNYGPDLILTRYFTYSGIPSTLAGGLLSVPTFATVHGAGVRFSARSKGTRAPLKKMAKKILTRYDRVFPVSMDLAGELLDMGLAKSRVIHLPNGVDQLVFRPRKDVSRSTDILFSGSIYPEKRLDVLLDALGILEKSGREPSVEIFGDGPSRDDWERMSRSKKNVRFRGWAKDMSTVYPRARMFVLSSDVEGCPNALLEAMACQVPAVATSVGDVPLIVTEGVDGYVVAPGDPQAMADALARLLDNPDRALRMGAKARRSVVSRFTWDAVASRILEEYSVVRGGGA